MIVCCKLLGHVKQNNELKPMADSSSNGINATNTFLICKTWIKQNLKTWNKYDAGRGSFLSIRYMAAEYFSSFKTYLKRDSLEPIQRIEWEAIDASSYILNDFFCSWLGVMCRGYSKHFHGNTLVGWI